MESEIRIAAIGLAGELRVAADATAAALAADDPRALVPTLITLAHRMADTAIVIAELARHLDERQGLAERVVGRIRRRWRP